MKKLLILLFLIPTLYINSQTIEDIYKDYNRIKNSLGIKRPDTIKFIGFQPLNFDSIYECDFPFNGVTSINKFNGIWMTEIQINICVKDGTEMKYTMYHELMHAEFLYEHDREGLMREEYDPKIQNIDSLLVYFLNNKIK